MRILVVEDDELTAQALTTILGQQNYAVEVATDGEAGWALADSFDFDLILLDVELPRLNGLELCRRLRSHHHQVPILLLTGRDSGHDKAVGLDAGADDYVVKPFDPEELVARIRALLRRSTGAAQPMLEWGNLHLDPSTCQVAYAGTPLSLTPKEYALLELFMRNNRRVFSCGAILEHVWAFEDIPGEEAVRTHIKGLRHKLKAAGAPADLIETVYGIGYRMKPLVAGGRKQEPVSEKRKPRNQRPKPSKLDSPVPERSGTPGMPTRQQTLDAIARVWERLKPKTLEQISVLQAAGDALATQRLGDELHQQARREAHSLAGSLGTFGFAQASKLARDIETLLEQNELNPSEVQSLHSLIDNLRREIDQPDSILMGSSSPASGMVPVSVCSAASPPSNHLSITARVLALDDDPKILAVLHELLEPWGVRLTTLDDPRQFWDVLHQTNPDLIILDLQMPYHSGIELCQAIRESDRWSGLPVMILTAHNEATIVDQVFSSGADDFVRKPIVGSELVTRIMNRLERVRLRRRLSEKSGTSGEEPEGGNSSNAEIAFLPLLTVQAERFFNLSLDMLCIAGFDGYFKRVNPAFEQTLGYCREELLTHPFSDFVHPDDRAKTAMAMDQLQQGLPLTDFENRYRCKDGSYKYLVWRSMPVLEEGVVYAIAHDVTQRKQNEAAWRKTRDEIELRVAERTAELVSLTHRLQKELDTAKRLEEERDRVEADLRVSQARFAGILEIADDAIISIDKHQRITLYNQGAEKIFGYSAEEIIGQPLDVLLPISSVQVHRQHVKEFGTGTAQARRMGERRPIFGRRKDGTEFPAEASISRLDRGEEQVFTVILRDITERQKVDRMKDEFISVVSHELRTPLTSIQGSLGMLASGLLSADSERGRRLLQIAVDSTDRLVRLINDILDIERIESGKVQMEMKPCDVSDLIERSVNEVQGLADKAQIILSVSKRSVQIMADGDRIIQTLTNLLSNAIKFSNPGSTVWLSTEVVDNVPEALKPQPPKLSIQNSACSSLPAPPSPLPPPSASPTPSPLLLFTVKDQGRGIPADKLESIFERFQQVDASDSRHHDGTGLGLTICRSIVQQHGGEIWVESTPGKGSTFYFTLPIQREEK
jgi:PAS domain S-box-containing protein